MQSVAIGNYAIKRILITLDGQPHFVSEAALRTWSVCHGPEVKFASYGLSSLISTPR